MRVVLGMCLAALALGGCGQKGPLYLPDQKTQVVVTGAQPPPATPTPPPKSPTDPDDPSQP